MPLQITSASNYSINDGIITANYSEEIFTSQLEANHFVNPNPGGINNGRGRSKLGKKSSFLVNLLVTLAVAFAALTAYFAFTTGLGVIASAYLAYTATTSIGYFWLANLGPVGWTIAAVIAILAIAGVDVGSELADFEDSVKEFGSDIDDAIFGEDGLLGGLF
jgi:hypothetical protein